MVADGLAHRAHNPEVGGSSPSPATLNISDTLMNLYVVRIVKSDKL